MNLTQPTLDKIRTLFPRLEGFGVSRKASGQLVWSHAMVEEFNLDETRVRRLSSGFFFMAEAGEGASEDALMDLIHCDDDSCYCLLPHVTEQDLFFLFAWPTSAESSHTDITRAYLVRDLLTSLEVA